MVHFSSFNKLPSELQKTLCWVGLIPHDVQTCFSFLKDAADEKCLGVNQGLLQTIQNIKVKSKQYLQRLKNLIQ